MANVKRKTSRPRHVPQRTCVVCREKHDKRALVRIVRTEAGSLVVDYTGKQNGRGAYICQKLACWETAVSQPHILAKALKTEITTADLATVAAERPLPTVNDAADKA